MTATLVPALPPRRALAYMQSSGNGTVGVARQLIAELGTPARLALPGQDIVMISRAEDAQRVFFTEQDRYPKGEEYDVPGLGLRRGLVTVRGEEWRRDRAMLNPLFAKRHLRGLVPTMSDCVERMLERWEPGRLDLAHEMTLVTLDIAARTMFGDALSDAETERFGTALASILADLVIAGSSPLTWLGSIIPGVRMGTAARVNRKTVRRIDNAREITDELIERLIASRRQRAATDAEPDFLDLMLAATDEDGRPMEHAKLVDQSLTFLAAGHETTATALTWTFHELARHPEQRDRVLTELDDVLAGKPAGFDDVDRLPYTKACLYEAMRIHPPVYLSMRRAVTDDELAGHRIRKGTVVVLLANELHRDERFWPEPERFDPARFLPGAGADRPRAAYLPFGSGRRVCIGSQFATIEAVITLAGVGQRYVLDSAPDWVVREEAFTTLRPKGGLPMDALTRA